MCVCEEGSRQDVYHITDVVLWHPLGGGAIELKDESRSNWERAMTRIVLYWF